MDILDAVERSGLERLPPVGVLGLVGADGQAAVVPVLWTVPDDGNTSMEVGPADPSVELSWIADGHRVALIVHNGQALEGSQGFRVDGRVASSVDESGTLTLQPDTVRAWGSDREPTGPGHARRARLAGRMQAVVRTADYDPERVAASPERIDEFERVHERQPGYAGNVVVDLGGGKRFMITMWQTSEHAAAAREALGPVVGRLLAPLERSPSRLLGVGDVITTDLVLATAAVDGHVVGPR